ncbi:MAG: hypothetical protein KDC13_04225 [Bacteroidetes bacterium]|nr:hypothetical protein [Bacteroidota bacterium]
MRVIAEIPHPQLRITVFNMNNKYLVKFEAGPYEQVFKVAVDDVESLETLIDAVNDEMLEKVAAGFRQMHVANPWKNAS